MMISVKGVLLADPALLPKPLYLSVHLPLLTRGREVSFVSFPTVQADVRFPAGLLLSYVQQHEMQPALLLYTRADTCTHTGLGWAMPAPTCIVP